MIWKKNTYFEFKNKNLNFWGLFSLFLSVAFLLGISLSRKQEASRAVNPTPGPSPKREESLVMRE